MERNRKKTVILDGKTAIADRVDDFDRSGLRGEVVRREELLEEVWAPILSAEIDIEEGHKDIRVAAIRNSHPKVGRSRKSIRGEEE